MWILQKSFYIKHFLMSAPALVVDGSCINKFYFLNNTYLDEFWYLSLIVFNSSSNLDPPLISFTIFSYAWMAVV